MFDSLKLTPDIQQYNIDIKFTIYYLVIRLHK